MTNTGTLYRDCCHTITGYPHTAYCPERFVEEPLAEWERELLTGFDGEGFGDVTFHRTDGSTVTIENLRVDGIGIDAGTEKRGVVTATDKNDRIFHVPFVSYWTVEYK